MVQDFKCTSIQVVVCCYNALDQLVSEDNCATVAEEASQYMEYALKKLTQQPHNITGLPAVLARTTKVVFRTINV